ncbi:uncharacterized protein LOC135820732 isoform X1 [Sycon ciliatum]|uniref:uncharacterized protein LOC135820732 isoform X1 n=1 Tax=Sycon ciliatum TaxID=27933 RepID=UPI0031F5FAA5
MRQADATTRAPGASSSVVSSLSLFSSFPVMGSRDPFAAVTLQDRTDTDAAKLSPAPACAEIPLLSTDDTAAQSPATAAAAAAAASSGDGNSSQGGKPPPSPPSCLLSDMACLSSYEIDGLRRLLAELNVSTTMVRACPEELGDPGELMSTVEILLNEYESRFREDKATGHFMLIPGIQSEVYHLVTTTLKSEFEVRRCFSNHIVLFHCFHCASTVHVCNLWGIHVMTLYAGDTVRFCPCV